ncbi:MAG: hypothetical protein QOG71_3210, partial [Pyrinomonadaceae bacterium]|nr:hypothetical protein [Pyrinomonadaceae bacterium]
RLRGTLQSVTLRPHGGVLALVAELYDGTGTAYVVWLGRRRIEGIRAGAAMVVEGRLGAPTGGRRTIYPFLLVRAASQSTNKSTQ